MKNYEKELDDFIKAIKESTKILKDFNEQAEERAIEKIAFSKEKFMWDNWKNYYNFKESIAYKKATGQIPIEHKTQYAICEIDDEGMLGGYWCSIRQEFVPEIRCATLYSSKELAIEYAKAQIKDYYGIVKVNIEIRKV